MGDCGIETEKFTTSSLWETERNQPSAPIFRGSLFKTRGDFPGLMLTLLLVLLFPFDDIEDHY